MTTGQQLIQQGLRQGSEQGIEQGIPRGMQQLFASQLRSRFGELDAATTARIHSATIAELERWGLRLLSAGRLEDVFLA